MEETPVYQYLKTKNITESSLKLYMNNLRRLNEGIYPKNLNFLKNTEKILSDLEKFKKNTRRAYLISIITALKGFEKLKKVYEKYYPFLDELNKEGSKNNEKSETQKENWLSQEEVREKYENLNQEIQGILNSKKINAGDYEKLIRWLILSFYTLQKPRRNMDYQMLMVVNKYDDSLDKSFNYFDFNKFYFNNYKTSGTYKTQIVDATPEMVEVIKSFLKFHPHRQGLKKKDGKIRLLVDINGEPFLQKNKITKTLNSIFDKKIGVSMLRNIYLTDKFGDKVKELEQTSGEMGTSSNTIMNNYIKID